MNIINDWLKTYLIGPMEDVAQGDGGRGWRATLREEFAHRFTDNGNGVFVFDPTLEEVSKVGMETETLHKKIQGWLASGNNHKIKEYGSLIWEGKTYIEKTDEGKANLVHVMGDIDYVKNSDFLIARMEKGDRPCGTYFEVGIALEHKTPIYVIQTMARKEYSLSFVQAVFTSGGDFFDSSSALLEFLDKKYKLKYRKRISDETN
jgi:hypothetical protein